MRPFNLSVWLPSHARQPRSSGYGRDGPDEWPSIDSPICEVCHFAERATSATAIKRLTMNAEYMEQGQLAQVPNFCLLKVICNINTRLHVIIQVSATKPTDGPINILRLPPQVSLHHRGQLVGYLAPFPRLDLFVNISPTVPTSSQTPAHVVLYVGTSTHRPLPSADPPPPLRIPRSRSGRALAPMPTFHGHP